MDKEELFCKFSIEGEDIHANIHGMDLGQVTGITGAALNDYLNQTMKGKTFGEKKKEALSLCRRFCVSMRIDTQDLNPWYPVSKIPYSNRPWNSPILISDNAGEHMCVGEYDERIHAFINSDGDVFEDAVWWKKIPCLPQPQAFYDRVIAGEE